MEFGDSSSTPSGKWNLAMQLKIAKLAFAGVLFLSLTAAALAGPLPLDPAGISWAQGSKIISSAKITATVEYSVYAPGQFSSSLALGNPADPSLGADYVYAYEVFSSSVPFKDLTIATVSGSIPLAYAGTNHVDNVFAPNGGTAPTAEIFNVAISPSRIINAKWTFSTAIDAGTGFSNILFFTSPYSPQFNTASISGGGTNLASSTLPSPIPEPATVTLAAVAAACLLAARRFRSRTA
jgi:hypothetical protein